MRAVWYERQGPASDVLRVGELPVPQLARWGGATVVGTVRFSTDLDGLDTSLAVEVVALDRLDPVATIAERAPQGVDRIIEVAFSDNVDLDAAVARNNTVIAAYGTR